MRDDQVDLVAVGEEVAFVVGLHWVVRLEDVDLSSPADVAVVIAAEISSRKTFFGDGIPDLGLGSSFVVANLAGTVVQVAQVVEPFSASSYPPPSDSALD